MAVAVGFDAYAVPKKDGYKLVWKDNFDGSALNRDYWNVEVNGSGCGNNELQYYVDNADNVAVRDGNLVITARRQDYDGHAFTSGRVNTCGKVGFTYGIVEARIKLPKTANGLWPAFWMMGDDIKECGWPACGETDVLEMGHADGIMDGTQDACSTARSTGVSAPTSTVSRLLPESISRASRTESFTYILLCGLRHG
mgnify:CR=1 FL=1